MQKTYISWTKTWFGGPSVITPLATDSADSVHVYAYTSVTTHNQLTDFNIYIRFARAAKLELVLNRCFLSLTYVIYYFKNNIA